jgi:hypothetical protein
MTAGGETPLRVAHLLLIKSETRLGFPHEDAGALQREEVFERPTVDGVTVGIRSSGQIDPRTIDMQQTGFPPPVRPHSAEFTTS